MERQTETETDRQTNRKTRELADKNYGGRAEVEEER